MNAHNDDMGGFDSNPHSDGSQPVKTPPATDYERLNRVAEYDRILDEVIADLKAKRDRLEPSITTPKCDICGGEAKPRASYHLMPFVKMCIPCRNRIAMEGSP
jgi:hypothetical protein